MQARRHGVAASLAIRPGQLSLHRLAERKPECEISVNNPRSAIVYVVVAYLEYAKQLRRYY